MDSIHILVIEDNPGDARLIQEYLKSDTSVDFLVHITTTLADSLKTLASNKFDVVLVDLGLPDSQGIYTFHEIINANPGSPVVIVTGNDDESMGIEAVRNGAQNYLVKNQINANLLIRTIKYAIEIKRINIELKENQEKYCAIFEGAASLIITISPDGTLINCNNRIQQLLGYSKDEAIGKPVTNFFHPDSHEKTEKLFKEIFENTEIFTGEFKMIRGNGEVITVNINSSALKDENNKNAKASCIIDDISDRKLFEKQQSFMKNILSILNRKNEWSKLVKDILIELKEFTEIEAVAIRHKKGGDYPYFESIGFPDPFIKKENFLCVSDSKGELIYDPDGKPLLECMCGNIISNRTDSSLDFFTEGGSFWTNSTTKLLAATTYKERQCHTRNYCNKAGYESVALIPLISENERIGLLQLNDKRPDRFNKDMIRFLEEIGSTIGIAFKRMESEKLIMESEERYRKLFESAKDGILILNYSNGEVVDVNPFLLEMLGFSHGKLIGKELWEIGFFKDIGISRDTFMKMKNKEYVRFKDMTAKIKNGEIINIEFISNVYKVNNLKVVQCSIRDITERKKSEEQLMIAKEKAEENDLLKTAFLQNISHEIRTPMNAIVGFCGFLDNPDLLPEKRKEFTDIIINCSVQLLSVITDIVSIATIETGQEKVNENKTNINSVCRLVYDQFFSKAQLKDVEFNYNTRLSDTEAFVITDETKLIKVLNNLINNALKFTAQGLINFGYREKDNYLEFYVKDTGIGIPSGFKEKIFERFYQTDYSSTRQYGGSGLGLSISRAYVELLGGTMWLTSKSGKGSVFYFTIPYKKAVSKGLSEKLPVHSEKSEFEKPVTILIAEDEDFNFMLLEEILSDINITVIRAVNGMEAVEKCKSNKHIDLVFMDIKMPVMNGYEATKKIKEFMPGLPVIAITAYSGETERAKALSCGCSDFISKPIDNRLVVSKIKLLKLP